MSDANPRLPKYDNLTYWHTLHKELGPRLCTVGHPWLSEALNELKYQSEAATLFDFLQSHQSWIRQEVSPTILDLGAGTGFWSEAVYTWFCQHGVQPIVTVLDISEHALGNIKARHPEFDAIHADLKTVDPCLCDGRFGLVLSFYCLHHLPRISDFLNALRFAARSVEPGGVLLIMDPVLSQPYSAFHAVQFSSHEGNGMPRPLGLIDDISEDEGLHRVAFKPAVSFILNGSIEAYSRIGFALTARLWQLLQRVYRSERATRTVGGLLRRTDHILKRKGLGYSSSLLAYRRKLS